MNDKHWRDSNPIIQEFFAKHFFPGKKPTTWYGTRSKFSIFMELHCISCLRVAQTGCHSKRCTDAKNSCTAINYYKQVNTYDEDKELMTASPATGVPSGEYHDSNINGLKRDGTERFRCHSEPTAHHTNSHLITDLFQIYSYMKIIHIDVKYILRSITCEIFYVLIYSMLYCVVIYDEKTFYLP